MTTATSIKLDDRRPAALTRLGYLQEAIDPLVITHHRMHAVIPVCDQTSIHGGLDCLT